MRLSRLAVTLVSSFVALSLSTSGIAQTGTPTTNRTGDSIGVITPIFSQLVYYRVPANFVPVFEDAKDNHYLHEWVLPGESFSNWTQMLTLTGAQDFSIKNPGATPKAFAVAIASGFKRACPASFRAKEIYEGRLNAHDAFIMVVSCGNAAASAGHSETAAIAVVKGERDFYTLQWAQRGDATSTPTDIDVSMWAARIKSLMPVKLCSITAGEKPPYPSCVGN